MKEHLNINAFQKEVWEQPSATGQNLGIQPLNT